MNSIGLIELSSIAAGMQAADMMLKTSQVELILSRTICAGKFMVLIGGDVAAVQAAVSTADENLEESVIDTFVIPNVHPDIFPAINGSNLVEELNALRILESFSVASLIYFLYFLKFGQMLNSQDCCLHLDHDSKKIQR